MNVKSGGAAGGGGYGQLVRPRRAAAAFLLIALLLSVSYAFPFSTDDARADTAYDTEELQFFDLINDYRADNGLGELILSDDITVAAERHNEDMGEYGFFAHDSADSSYYEPGSEPWDRMAAEGYDYDVHKGENLAAGYETAEEVFAAWKASPSHNSAMLDGNYRVVGVSRLDVKGSPFGWYWTTDFGSFVDQSASTDDDGQKPDERRADARSQNERNDNARDATRNAVRNGGFVGEDSWEQRARDDAKLILRGQLVRMGGYDDGSDRLRQRMKIEPGAVLRYDLKVSSTGDGDPDDLLTIRLTDEDGKPVASALRRYSGRDEMGWSRQGVKLSRFAGRDLYLTFDARTNGEGDTYFYIDNVSSTV